MHHLKVFERFVHYIADTQGQIAVWFAVMALPLLAGTSLVLDQTQATRIRVELSSALDHAALAAVLDQTLSTSERGVTARRYFEENFSQSDTFELNVVESGAERVELNANGFIPASLSSALGREGFRVSDKSVSVLTQGGTVCVLALDPSGKGAFRVQLGSTYESPDCSVQVNSSHEQAAIVDGASRSVAKYFCVTGGASGAFTPPANTECGEVKDPYADLIAPESGPCTYDKKLKLKSNGKNAAEDGYEFSPGTYCGGIDVSGLDVTFLPGQYVIQDGPLVFKKDSSAFADDVTFIMRGPRATLNINNGSSLYVKAPSSGPMAGLAFYQDPTYDKSKSKGPSAENTLNGGSEMTIIGTLYFPTQEIIIKGGSGLSADAPATSFIGYRVAFTDEAEINVNSDHLKAGLPPLEPRVDSSARLVR